MKIGIYGGTFDPFHCGHLEPVIAARELMQWDRVYYVPAFVQPFKQDRTFASPYHRFAMIAASIVDHDFLYVSSMELERGRVSYTVESLEELREDYPDETIDWVIGDDHFLKLHEWRNLGRIFELANFAVLTRKDHDIPPAFASRVCKPAERSSHGSISFTSNPRIEISSTDVRRRLQEGEPIDDLVPPAVSRYIHHYGLYRKGQS
jgi:nicotinate-nucleotide adenylyltransferase